MKNKVFKPAVLSILLLTFLGCSSGSDSCKTIPCKNGGIFIDCGCNCPEGYTGGDCSEQITPSKITISKVIVRLFPLLNANDEPWDAPLSNPDAYPDVYFQLIKGSSTILYDSPTFFENADLTSTYEFTLNTPIEISDYSVPYIISLLDYDPIGNDENIASEAFYFYEDGNGFPSTLTVLDSTQPIAVDLELDYQF